MFGIEYSALARAIKGEEATSNEPLTLKKNLTNINTSDLDLTEPIKKSETDILLHKIRNLSKIPDYLKPNLYINSINCEIMKNSSIKGQYSDDFILICEFSEIEGPKPLLSIPNDAGADFNKNEYALHLMCVDFHSHNPIQNNENEKKFRFSADTTIVNFWDKTAQITSCIQHFTLYDIEARGFVRPFCMAYISNDHKAVEFFENIKEKFSQVTDLFRKGNLVLFKQELEQKCSDLRYTRDIFEKWRSSDTLERSKIEHDFYLDENVVARLNFTCSSEANTKKFEDSIKASLNETEDILHSTNEELTRRNWHKTKSLFSNFNQIEKSRSYTYPLSNEDNLTLNIDNYQQDKVYRPKIHINALCGSFSYVSGTKPNTRKEKQKNMKKLHQLCPTSVTEALNQLKLTHKYFSTSFHLLKYKKNFSTRHSLKHNIFWSITAGDSFISDFSLHIDTHNLNKTIIDKKVSINRAECGKSATDLFSSFIERTQTTYHDVPSEQTFKNYSWNNLEDDLDLFEESVSLNDQYLSVNETNFSNQEIMYEDESLSKKELNEFDFANSLLAIYPSNNSLAVSLSSSSIGLFYKALNSLRYQSSLTDKIVQFQEFNFEENFKNLYQKFPVALPHIFFSLLKGRAIVCVSRYSSDQIYLQSVLDCLSNLVPNSFYCINSLGSNQAPKFTSSPQTNSFSERPKLKCIHERKPIRLTDLKNCKLFGLSLMLTQNSKQDNNKLNDENIEHLLFTYIPITIRNYVSILDLDDLTFLGPKYTGSYLINTLLKCPYFINDSFTYLFLITNVFFFYTKLAFVYEYSILYKQDNFEGDSLITEKFNQSSTSNLMSLNRKEKLRKLLSVKNKKNKSKFEIEFEMMNNFFCHATNKEISLDKSDLKIVSYFLKSLKMKQIYLFNLAMHKKEVKEMNKLKKDININVPLIDLVSNNRDTTEPNYKINIPDNNDIQMPLLVEFEEIHFFKKKN